MAGRERTIPFWGGGVGGGVVGGVVGGVGREDWEGTGGERNDASIIYTHKY